MGNVMPKAAAPKKRRLSDLYVVGKEVVFEDPDGDVVVYLRRPNPFEHEEALRDGNLARSRSALRMADPTTSEGEVLLGEIAALGDHVAKAELIFTDSTGDFYQRAVAWVGEQEPWNKDDYVTALEDSLNDYDEDPPEEGDENWEDYQRVKGELEKFSEAVEKKLEAFKVEQVAEYCSLEPEELDAKVRKLLIDRNAGIEFFRAYRLGCLYFSVRDPEDHGKRYFNHKQEIRELPAEIQARLLSEYDALDVPRDQIKNSPSAEASSELSAPSPSPETSEPSGPEESDE